MPTTVPTATGPQVFNTLLISGKESASAYGVAVGANLTMGSVVTDIPTAIFHWVTEPNFQARALRHIADEGFRGVAGQMFDLIPGPGEGTIGFGGMVYLDAFPHIMNNMLGYDVVTTPATVTYMHTMTAAPTPLSYTYRWAQGIKAYEFTGGRLSNLRLSFNAADGALTYSTQGMSKLGTSMGTNPLDNYWYPTDARLAQGPAVGGWQGLMTIDGQTAGTTGYASVLEGELTRSRQLTPIHSLNGTQDLSQIYPGPLQVEGRLTLDWYDKTYYEYFSGTGITLPGALSKPITLKFTQVAGGSFGAGERSMAITITKAGFRQVDIERSGAIYTQVLNFVGEYNLSDTGPAKAVFMNGVSAAYGLTPS